MSVPVAVIGSGNIGTDLMVKIIRTSPALRVAAMAGIDPASDGLARARRLGVATTADGVEGLLALPEFADVAVVFDATSAGAHGANDRAVQAYGARMVDLTPAALGPFVVPTVNLEGLSDAANLNLVTCGGQATIPVVAAVSRVAQVPYAEIVASIASRSAGPGTRANIDEFTETTARGLEQVGGAGRGKAIIVLNPANPPIIMRDTVSCLVEGDEPGAIRRSVLDMVAEVQEFVPGYRLKHDIQVEQVDLPHVPALDRGFTGLRVTVFLEVRGAGHYLPEYAGNLDIMTSAALRVGERLADRQVVA